METNAKELLERAIELEPNLANAHFKLGTLYQAEKDFSSAIKFSKKQSPWMQLSLQLNVS